jgi:hypothetical protein
LRNEVHGAVSVWVAEPLLAFGLVSSDGPDDAEFGWLADDEGVPAVVGIVVADG